VNFPPYHPYIIQYVSSCLNEQELMMSDVPWAVAWYGQRQCIWLTLDAEDEFFAINDLTKPVRGLYLSPLTMDSRFATDWIKPGQKGWGQFILEWIVVRGQLPLRFPLRVAMPNLLPDQIFLSDRMRWSDSLTNPPVTPVAQPPGSP
jgi:hypothetical protein